MDIPTGRRFRRRWRGLDDDTRELIRLHVDAGKPLPEPTHAALAVTLAQRVRRDVLWAVTAGPPLLMAGVAAGAAMGRYTRGGDAADALLTIVLWGWGLAWVGVAAVVTGLLLLATRRWRRRLRRAERVNRERLTRS